VPVCAEDGCPEQVPRGTPRCPEHEAPVIARRKARERQRSRERDAGRYSRDRRWQRVRRLALERDSYRCHECGASVKGKAQANVDHLDGQGLDGPRAYDLDNLVSLCRSCHSRKTARHDGGFGNRRRPRSSLPGYDPDVDTL
jgi:5-methylcytosine-specific restriction protein A